MDNRRPCPTCSGRGVIFTPEDLDHTTDNWYEECPECSGSGIVQHGDTDGRSFVALSTEDYITTLALLGNAWCIGRDAESFRLSLPEQSRMTAEHGMRALGRAVAYAFDCASI